MKSNSEAPNDESRRERRVMSKRHWFRYRRVVELRIDVMCCAGCVASIVGSFDSMRRQSVWNSETQFCWNIVGKRVEEASEGEAKTREWHRIHSELAEVRVQLPGKRMQQMDIHAEQRWLRSP